MQHITIPQTYTLKNPLQDLLFHGDAIYLVKGNEHITLLPTLTHSFLDKTWEVGALNKIIDIIDTFGSLTGSRKYGTYTNESSWDYFIDIKHISPIWDKFLLVGKIEQPMTEYADILPMVWELTMFPLPITVKLFVYNSQFYNSAYVFNALLSEEPHNSRYNQLSKSSRLTYVLYHLKQNI